ncbi:WYL domain-containing protein [Luteipulveratus sp. YIM 133132]|uniref:helix-turn-helix transcriptional regulator n=1 Tax=Luteipulveratus flavus TaxID=3031728 RepID=UPI0023B1F1DF|nr:WYL domain-containing protein [Luteipulveratus sp. YIM 133132]MDE9367416.1 WYL domain-containing protein [Luteipulveratus sp. YIM 133132]
MPAATTPAAKTERLLNLVICLLYTRQPLSKARIRSAVPQYGEAASDEAFDRMFERDKDELRELGIPLKTEPVDAFFDDETGYRIDQREYALPEIAFEADELAVLGLASRTWQQASLGGPAAQAMRKLQAEDVERDTSSVLGLEPRVRTNEPAFEPVKDAVVQRRTIRFGYRKRGSQVEQRRVQPWAITSWHGRWYLTGQDLGRGAPRVFRLSRIEGAVTVERRADPYDVPAGHDPVEMIAGTEDDRAVQVARLRVLQGAGNTLRRRARDIGGEGGWSVLEVEFRDDDALANEIAGFGPAVVVLEPASLVDGVVRRLTAVRALHEGAA